MQLVIAGGGLAAARAIEGARGAGFDGEIVLIGEEPHLPYHRPALSKEALTATTELAVHPEAFYRDNRVTLLRSRRAVRLDARERSVVLDDGASVRFDRLLIATGSTSRRLHLPGAQLDGVLALRTLDDGQRLASRLVRAQDVVIVGAGLIGLEVASVARTLGKRVTVLEGSDAPLRRVVGASIGRAVAAMHVDQGVAIRTSCFPEAFLGGEAVEAVLLEDGSRIPADLVLVAIGVRPAVGWLLDGGPRLDDGVVVDEHMQSNLPGVYAAGDVARGWVPLYGRHMRLEHEGNAHVQGLTAGRLLAGEAASYAPVPGASSTQYGKRLQVIGAVSGQEQVVVRQGDEPHRFVAHYVQDGRLMAAATLDWGRELLAAKRRLGRPVEQTAA